MDRAEQFQRNLDLAVEFIGGLLDDPSRLDAIPNGAHIVLMPENDPELYEANKTLLGRTPMNQRIVMQHTTTDPLVVTEPVLRLENATPQPAPPTPQQPEQQPQQQPEQSPQAQPAVVTTTTTTAPSQPATPEQQPAPDKPDR